MYEASLTSKCDAAASSVGATLTKAGRLRVVVQGSCSAVQPHWRVLAWQHEQSPSDLQHACSVLSLHGMYRIRSVSCSSEEGGKCAKKEKASLKGDSRRWRSASCVLRKAMRVRDPFDRAAGVMGISALLPLFGFRVMKGSSLEEVKRSLVSLKDSQS